MATAHLAHKSEQTVAHGFAESVWRRGARRLRPHLGLLRSGTTRANGNWQRRRRQSLAERKARPFSQYLSWSSTRFGQSECHVEIGLELVVAQSHSAQSRLGILRPRSQARRWFN